MGPSTSGLSRALRALGGAAALAVAAAAVPTFLSAPTLVDRALPLLVVVIWGLGSMNADGLRREIGLFLVPLIIALEIGIPDPDLRAAAAGAVVAIAAVLHLSQLPKRWSAEEILTALLLVAPMRLVTPSIEAVTAQGVFMAGAVTLWLFLRRRSGPWLVAGVVLLMSASIPAQPTKLALVPWILATFVWVSRRDGWVAHAVIALVSLLVAKWLALVFVLVIIVEVVVRKGLRGPAGAAPPAFVPGLAAIPSNLPGVILPVAFFPALLAKGRVAIPLVAAVALALVVRPSLGPVIVLVGVVLACARESIRSGSKENRALALPSLALAGVILFFFPWSGALVSRPPTLLSITPTLAIAALALLPPVFRGYSGLVGLMLFLSAALVMPGIGGEVLESGRVLAPGESIVIELAPRDRAVELRVAGANLAGAQAGAHVGWIEWLDAEGNGYSKPIRIGQIADWGAFRPAMVLGTWNPRPDLLSSVEGHGIESWARGTGRIRIDGAIAPRWLVITADPQLEKDQQLIIEEVVLR